MPLSQISERLIHERLRQRGYRMTASRNSIVRAIVGLEDAFTIQALLLVVQELDAGIGRATVFRTVDLMVTEGILDQVHLADGARRYTLAPSEPVHYHHLVCSACEKIVPFEGCTVGTMIAGLERETGFTISDHQLELFGVCDECRVESSVHDVPTT